MFSGSTLMSGCSFSNVATSSSGVALGSSKWYHQRIVAFFCACGRASGVAASGSCSAEQCASFHWHFPPAIDGTITAAKQLFVPTASWLPFSPHLAPRCRRSIWFRVSASSTVVWPTAIMSEVHQFLILGATDKGASARPP
jgi:hypothetical protein